MSDDDDDGDVLVKQFTAPSFEESLNFEPGTNNTNRSDNNINILLWIFKFQSRFCLPDTAIESLIQFIKMVLIDANHEMFKGFPTSIYTAKQSLGIEKQEKTYAVCSNCNALYNSEEILIQTGFKCTHVEFPNHPMQNRREPCGTELLMKVPVNDGYIERPKMTFPMPSLKTQLITMYQRSGFEESLRKWANRGSEDGLYSDIYDGEIWKTFPSSLDDPDSRFFTFETADFNLGIMINLD